MLINVRVTHYKSYRGRPNGTETMIVPALAIMHQQDGSLVVELQKPVFGFSKWHNLAVWSNQIVK